VRLSFLRSEVFSKGSERDEKTSTKKALRKKTSMKSKARTPVDLQAIRETIANIVGANARDICCALAELGRRENWRRRSFCSK
jgi:hypothetical protein